MKIYFHLLVLIFHFINLFFFLKLCRFIKLQRCFLSLFLHFFLLTLYFMSFSFSFTFLCFSLLLVLFQSSYFLPPSPSGTHNKHCRQFFITPSLLLISHPLSSYLSPPSFLSPFFLKNKEGAQRKIWDIFCVISKKYNFFLL